MFYVRNDIKCKIVYSLVIPKNVWLLAVKVYIQNTPILIVTIYVHSVFIENFDEWLTMHFSNYQGKILLVGDFSID